MEQLTNPDWWEAASTRALKTMAQAALGVIGASTAVGDVDWRIVLGACVLSAIVSLLTSLAGLPEVDAQGDEGKAE